MQRHDKDRLIISIVVGAVLYAVLFFFLNPLDWLEKQRFLEPFGPLVVEFEALPETNQDTTAQEDEKEPEPPELDKPPDPKPEPVKGPEPEPKPDVRPAEPAPKPVSSKPVSEPSKEPLFQLKQNLEDSATSSGGPSLRAEEGELNAPPSKTGTEVLTLPNPGDKTGESGVVYADDEPGEEDKQQTSVIPVQQVSPSDELISKLDNIVTNKPKDTPSPQPENTVKPKQAEFESLDELTENRQPNGVLEKPAIPDSVKRDGAAEYEVFVSFLLTEGGAIKNVEIDKSSVHPDLEANIRTAIRKWAFVPTPGSGSVKVTLRYVIKVE